MMKVFDIKKIQQIINIEQDLEVLIETQKQAFIDFTSGKFEVPLPMQLRFPDRQGDCHVKAGFKKLGNIFVIKVASGFYNNHVMGLPTGDGALLIFSQKTGLIEAILYDGGWLTTLRTAIAGLIAASITPWKINNIGIIGTGSLARLVHSIIKKQYPKSHLNIYGRDANKASSICNEVCASIPELLAKSDLVISTTASTEVIIHASDLQGPKHIIALGADDIHKRECDPAIFAQADVVIIDSLSQAAKFGDTFHAIKAGAITLDKVVELGSVLQSRSALTAKLIITDLTGIAAQDVAIAEFILKKIYQEDPELSGS